MLKKGLLIFCLFSLLSGLLLFPLQAEPAQKHVTIKFATVAPEGSSWMKHMRRLEKVLKEKSDGRIRFRIYPGGIAGDELDVLRKMRIGQIHCAAFTGVGFGQILPMVRILDLPFLFKNYEETDLVHGVLLDFFSERFREKGFELLSWAEVGNVHLFSQRPIGRIEDLAGLKVWTWSGDPISKETFSLMGNHPIPLSVTDVTTALNTGMVDTVYAPPLGALALQWHHYLKYMTSLPLAHATGAVLISSLFFEKMPESLSAMLKREFHRAMADLTHDLRRQSEEAVRLIEKSGLVVMPAPSEEDLEDFRRIHRRVAERLTDRVYPKRLLDRVYDVLKRNP